MKGFGIEIKNDLLEPKHVEAMGQAVWLYMWLIDKMTSITEDGVGKVLGGKPVKYPEVAKELGMSQDTYTRWIEKLEEYPYIETVRTPYGIKFKVLKAKKRFRNSTEPKTERIRTNAESTRIRTNAESNKTVTVDITEIKAAEQAPTAIVPLKVDSFFRRAGVQSDASVPMVLNDFVLMCRGSNWRHIRLIGEYADERKPAHVTRAQWREFGLRNMRAARQLAPYNDRQITDAIRKVKANLKERGGYLEKYSLETLIKYLD